ncbi:MAG: SURF1 family protein [Alphaproteobacteria bacterium]|nr:SURF1 family protein [Alphaproteobacteria bacterium]
MLNRFKPGLALTICTLLGLTVLIGLGTWQARKIGPKTDLLARIEAGLSAQPIALPVHLDDPSVLEFHRVTFKGQVLDRKPIKLFATNLSGKSGYHLYLPVLRQHGMTVMVNFGWVPFHQDPLPDLPVGQEVTITGVLRTSGTPGSMTPPNVPADNQWFTADVHEMAAHWGLRTKEYYHFRVFSDQRGAADALPQGGQVRVDIPNDHLQYAITWFGLAMTLLGVYIAFGFKRGRED